MPQLDYVINLSVLPAIYFSVLLSTFLAEKYLNEILLSFSETIFNFSLIAPQQLTILTSKYLTFGWVVLQNNIKSSTKKKRLIITERFKYLDQNA